MIASPLRYLVDCLDSLRVPLSAVERSDRAGSVPYWGANGIVDHVDRHLLDEPVILLGEDGAPFFDPARSVAFLSTGPIWPNNHIHVLRARPLADPRFLTYALNATDYGTVISGSTRDKLTQEDMGGIEIPTQSLADQRRIADFLDDHVARIDQIISARRSQIGLLDTQAGAALAEALLMDTDDTMPLRYLIESERLGIWGDEPGSSDLEVPVARVADFARGNFRLGPVLTVRSIVKSQLIGRELKHGDVLLERSGGTHINPVGCPAYVDNPAPATVSSNFVSRLRPAEDADGRYLSLVMGAMYVTRQQAPHSTQTTGIQNLNTGSYFQTRLPVRSHLDQTATAKIADSSLEAVRQHQSQLAKSIDVISEYKQSLITAAVTGELDVTTAGSGIPG